ncbi:MAG: hypothetical protein CL764_04100 [Chloroflexi bacterium]|nr:hypothetical protein [Chloroflexota bacterium]|tara:strand:+ start:3160 stop:4347 length:1188 start_codon:yes stop_codon:yes gene_type:complete
MSIRFFMLILIIIPNLFLACANTESKTIKEETIVEVIKEIPVEKEVIREVEIEKIIVQEKEIIKEVPVVETEVVEVVKTVEVYIDQKSDSLIDLSKVEGIVNPKNFSWPREIQAMNGNIVINQEPQRILTVSLGHDEMLFGFVELDKIVATTSFSQDPGGNIFEFSNGLPVITADPEVIIAQDPDIVFADPYANPNLLDALSDLNIPVIQTTLHNDVEGRRSDILLMGYALGELESAKNLINILDERIKFINSYTETKDVNEKPKILSLTYYDAYWAGGLGSTEGSIIDLAGGINIAAESGVQSNDMITKESLISMNPDVIIIPQSKEWGGESFFNDLISDNTLKEIQAIKNDKVYLVDPRYFTTLSHWNLRGTEELMKIVWDDLRTKKFIDFGR